MVQSTDGLATERERRVDTDARAYFDRTKDRLLALVSGSRLLTDIDRTLEAQQRADFGPLLAIEGGKEAILDRIRLAFVRSWIRIMIKYSQEGPYPLHPETFLPLPVSEQFASALVTTINKDGGNPFLVSLMQVEELLAELARNLKEEMGGAQESVTYLMAHPPVAIQQDEHDRHMLFRALPKDVQVLATASMPGYGK